MGFLFTSKKKKKETMVVIFDIGSGSVGGAIVEIPNIKGELPTIIKSVRTDIDFSESGDFDLLLKNTLKALNTTAQNLNKNNSNVIKEVFCVLASPWYLSETRIIKMERELPFIFTKRHADELLQKELFNLVEIYKKQYGEQDAPQIIENIIMGVSLDGQQTYEPINKKCKSVNLNILVSSSSNIVINNIKDSISNNFHHLPISFSSFISSSYIALRDKYISQDSHILIDMGGETTDVSIIQDGILKYSVSFPQGKKTLYRYISKSKNMELRDAEELFNLYTTDNLSSPIKNKIEPIFKSLEYIWNSNFNKCFENLPENIIIPKVVFLTADNNIKKWLTQLIQKNEYNPSKLGHGFNVLALEGSQFLNMCNVKNSNCDPFLMIEAISIMRKKNI